MLPYPPWIALPIDTADACMVPEFHRLCANASRQKPLCDAGASGSGKTTFTNRLKKVMNNVIVLSMDMYNDGSKVLEVIPHLVDDLSCC